MREHSDASHQIHTDSSNSSRAYIQLAFMFIGENHLSNLDPDVASELKPKLSEAHLVDSRGILKDQRKSRNNDGRER
jgi:hypothetical protein